MYQMSEDRLLSILLRQGDIRVIAISGRDMVEEARRIHSLSRVCTAALGRQLMATAMMASQLKHESESLTTIFRGDGPAGNLVCTGRYGALVKGYIANPLVELPLTAEGKLDVAGVMGRTGTLTVVRDLSLREPYVGGCDIVSGEIAEDFAQYFAVSEQQPSLVYLGVRVQPGDGAVLAAGGIIAQPLPGCPEEYIDELQALTGSIGELTLRLEQGEKLEHAVGALFRHMEPETVGSQTPLWRCDCSRARTECALIALGREELADMIERDGGAELTCQFCNEAYGFTADDIFALLEEANGAGGL